MKRIAWIFVLALVMGLVPAMADNWTWTFTEGTSGVVASGTLSGSLIVAGEYNITSGTIIDSALLGANVGTIYPNPIAPGVSTSPGYTAFYTDLLFPEAAPLLDNNGLLFVGPGGVPEINIYSTGPIAYYKYLGEYGGAGAPGDPGTFAIVATPDGGTSLSLLGLAIVGLAGLRRKLSL